MTLLALAALTLAAAPNWSAADVATHGVHVVAPAGWARSVDGTTVVYAAPEKQASVRVDTFEKDAATDPQDCLDQLIKKLSASGKESPDTYAPGVLDGQPSATQTTVSDDRKHRQRRIIGCNGKSYFLIDWVELTHAGPKYEKAFTQMLTGISYNASTTKAGK